MTPPFWFHTCQVKCGFISLLCPIKPWHMPLKCLLASWNNNIIMCGHLSLKFDLPPYLLAVTIGNCTEHEFLDLSEVGWLTKLISLLLFSNILTEIVPPSFLGFLSWRIFTWTKTTWLEKFHQMLELSLRSPAYG